MKLNGKQLFLSIILLVTGFILSFSYQMTEKQNRSIERNNEWKREDSLRSQILAIQKSNQELSGSLRKMQGSIAKKEKKLAEQEQTSYNMVEDLTKLRLLTGDVKAKGEGIEVTLSDASYMPEGENPNDYIVHEEHIRSVIDELLVSGAEAIAVNGQRISHDTFISCIGPVISVNGTQYPAPFVVTAIGDSSTLEKSMNLYITDKLVDEGIQVRVGVNSEITMEPYLTEES
ncbi:DUF881 domain-containing protein [Fictibacillus aquaticus]|uniref:DUF881 domain-containing protein n=1 Tax=Fictibacillus aquaticus TaxID=2021314 RepID=A0A235FC32_9BACL|nr:DUF881 domain-containing protein [Fictibacillus aquaticus]OYD58940.1 hypothetical protein CGZ90_03290 [Fictibacillus aquaticus]